MSIKSLGENYRSTLRGPTKLIENKICRTDLVSKIPQHLWFQVLEQLGCDSHLQGVNIFWRNSSWSWEILRMSKRVCWLSQKKLDRETNHTQAQQLPFFQPLSTFETSLFCWWIQSVWTYACQERGNHFLWTWSGWRFDLTNIFKKCFSLPSKYYGVPLRSLQMELYNPCK